MEDFVQRVAALRVDLAREGCPDYFVLVVEAPRFGVGFRDFYLVNKHTDETNYMFGAFVSADDEAVRMALYNGPDYLF